MTLSQPPVVKVQLLIRRPVEEVFAAFVDPTITTRFWFTHSSGRLEPGAQVRWEWRMYGATAEVRVEAIEPNRRIHVTWNGPAPSVEWTFQARPDGTLVTVTNSGFSREEHAVAQAIDSMGGFTSLLAGAKAFLEHRIELNLVGDHHPDAHR